MFNALISRLGEAIVGEMTLDEAYGRMEQDITQQIEEKKAGRLSPVGRRAGVIGAADGNRQEQAQRWSGIIMVGRREGYRRLAGPGSPWG